MADPSEQRVQLTAERVERLLAVTSGLESRSRRALLREARTPRHKFAPTLLSVWQAAGLRLPSPLLYEVDEHRAKIDRYRRVAEAVEQVADVRWTKGLELVNAYPDGIVRQINDLDAVVPDEAALWRVARLLAGEGWTLDGITLVRAGDRLVFYLVFRMQAGDPLIVSADRVELATVPFVGDFGAVPPLTAEDLGGAVGPAATLCMLAVEALERELGCRDRVDALVLLGRLDESEARACAKLIRQHALAPEWARLVGPLVDLDMGRLRERWPEPVLGRRAAARTRRAWRHAGRWRHPLAATALRFQRSLLRGERSRVPRLRSWIVNTALDVRRAHELGLPLFGVPLDPDDRGLAVADIRFRRHVLVADTPLGRFAFVAGDIVSAEWLEGLVPADGDEEALGSQPAPAPLPGRAQR